MELLDIIKKDGQNHIVTEIVIGEGARVETMPLLEFIARYHFMDLCSEHITIVEYLNREADKMRVGLRNRKGE